MAIVNPPEPEATIYRGRVNKPLKSSAEFLLGCLLAGALAGCDVPEPDRAEREAWEANQAAANAAAAAALAEPEVPPAALAEDPRGTRWETAASGEGASLLLLTPRGERRLVLFCRTRSGMVLVNVPRFHAVREPQPMRLATQSGSIDLAGDPRADPRRGGVSAMTPLTAELSALLGRLEPISVTYGGWSSGPHGEIMPEIARGFVAACSPVSG